MICPCPPCPVPNIRLRVTQVYAAPMNTTILVLCADDADTQQPFPVGTSMTWVSNLPFTVVPNSGGACIQVSLAVDSPVFVATVTISDATFPLCKTSATYVNTCVDDTLTVSYNGDCETMKTDVYACINNNCAYNPQFFYSWSTPGATGVVFVTPAHYQFNMQQTIPPPCTVVYRVSVINQTTGCQMSAVVAQNACTTQMTDWCNVPIGQTPFALLLACQ
jgi:hypothetical protein